MSGKVRLLMGNEAVALGAIRAGVSVVTGYPGTPSTEILETVAREAKIPGSRASGVYVEWSVNEKAALEIAAGAAISGARALVTMKQVGLNVASDPLMSLNYLGVAGGMVIAAADDPGPVSSQTEQDTRRFGLYAKIAVFDPATPEEAYVMIADAFDWSEKYGRPVLFRPTTRVCHSYASVELLPDLPKKQPAGFDKAGGRWVIFPSLANKAHAEIEAALVKMGKEFSSYSGNLLSGGESLPAGGGPPVPAPVLGIAAGGVSYAYALEYLDPLPAGIKLLKVGTFPFPADLALTFLAGLEKVLVLEELDPVIEDELTMLCGRHHLGVEIRGKRSGDMPRAGENSPAIISEQIESFLGKIPVNVSAEALHPEPPPLPVRPPVLCAGCPHRGSFFAVKEAVRKYGKSGKAVFSGDIGCYTLGNARPLGMTDTCLCMGGGITMAQGINRIEAPGARKDRLNFAFIGDSTFFHSGISGIVNAVYNRSDIIVVVLDNLTTAMTGGQPHPGMGKNAKGEAAGRLDIGTVAAALGVQEIVRADPFDLKTAIEAVKSILDKPGVRVAIFEGPCIAVNRGGEKCIVDPEKCTGCLQCVKKLGCPAISPETGGSRPASGPKTGKANAVIDTVLCTGCGICKEVCAFNAISGGSSGDGEAAR